MECLFVESLCAPCESRQLAGEDQPVAAEVVGGGEGSGSDGQHQCKGECYGLGDAYNLLAVAWHIERGNAPSGL